MLRDILAVHFRTEGSRITAYTLISIRVLDLTRKPLISQSSAHSLSINGADAWSLRVSLITALS